MQPAASSSLRRGFFTAEVSTGVLVFMVASTAILARILRAGVISTGFDEDVHLAASLARRYLQSPPGTDVVDMYTQGFLHPLLYVPLLSFLRAAGIPPQLQDGLAIAFVQAVAVGLIALLAYIGSRSLLNRGPALAVACLCIGLPLLLRPVDLAMTQLSPNGEILGSVLLLGIWAILVHRPRSKGAISWVIGLSVAAFHLKYQLVPQVAALIFGGGLGRQRALRLLAISLLACLLVDLIVYRLGGSGIFSRAGSLLVDYMGIVASGSPARAESGFSLRGMAVWLVIQIYTWTSVAPAKLIGNFRTISTEAPQFLLAWAVWLVPLLLRPRHHGPRFREHLMGALLLSLSTIAAILLPNKGFYHYYLLLIPTAVVVMATGLTQFSGFARSTLMPTRLAASQTTGPLMNNCWAALLALVPATALLFVTGLQLNRELVASGRQSKAALPADIRLAGLHVYGWNFRLFGLQDTYTINPNLDTLLATSWMKHDTSDYIRALTGLYSSPRFVLDHVASPNKGGVLAAANYPPLVELARRHGINLLALYKVRQINELGILYERISDSPSKPGR